MVGGLGWAGYYNLEGRRGWHFYPFQIYLRKKYPHIALLHSTGSYSHPVNLIFDWLTIKEMNKRVG